MIVIVYKFDLIRLVFWVAV